MLSASTVAGGSQATSEDVGFAVALRAGAAAAPLPTAANLGETTMFGDVPLKRRLLRAPSIPAAKCDGGRVGTRVTPGGWGRQPAPTWRMLGAVWWYEVDLMGQSSAEEAGNLPLF